LLLAEFLQHVQLYMQNLTMPAAVAPTRNACIIAQATFHGWIGPLNNTLLKEWIQPATPAGIF
jgi:hypothetical protein